MFTNLEFFSLFLKFSFPLAYSQLASFIQTSHSVSVSSQFHFQSALELKKKEEVVQYGRCENERKGSPPPAKEKTQSSSLE